MSTSAQAAAAVLTAPEPGLRLSWRPGWREAVEAFVKELVVKGYSAYTIRDYRTDVMRLGAWLDIRPADLAQEHLERADRLLAKEGFDLSARRRRSSAYARFLDYVHGRSSSGIGPAALDLARAALPEERLMLALVYFAGLRLAEVGGLEGRDIKLKKGVVVSREGCRVVPLHPSLAALFREVRHSLPLLPFRPVLPGQNGYPLNARTLHARFQRLANRIGKPELRPDTLRRETASFLADAGAPQVLVRAFLGKDRGRPVAPRCGHLLDLTCLADRLRSLPG